MLTTSETIFVYIFASGDTITILIIAKSIVLFFGLYIGHGDEASHVLGTVFVGRVSEDGGAHVAGPAIPAGTAMYARPRISVSFSVLRNFVMHMKKGNHWER